MVKPLDRKSWLYSLSAGITVGMSANTTHEPPIRVAIANTKGGTAKTSSTAYLGWQAAQAGERVLLVDTDPQRSLADWHTLSASDAVGEPWGFCDVVEIPGGTREGAAPVDYVDDGHTYTTVIVDCPPSDGHRQTITSALRASDFLLVPLSPSVLDVRRLAPTFELAAEVGIPAAAMVTQTRRGTVSERQILDLLDEAGHPATQTTIPLSEDIAQNAGEPFHVEAYAEIWAEPGSRSGGGYAG